MECLPTVHLICGPEAILCGQSELRGGGWSLCQRVQALEGQLAYLSLAMLGRGRLGEVDSAARPLLAVDQRCGLLRPANLTLVAGWPLMEEEKIFDPRGIP